MKTSRSNPSQQSSQGLSKKPRPEIRDDMDSRHQKGPKRADGKNPKGEKTGSK